MSLTPEEEERLVNRLVKTAMWQLTRHNQLVETGMAVTDLMLADNPALKIPDAYVRHEALCAYVDPFLKQKLDKEYEKIQEYFKS